MTAPDAPHEARHAPNTPDPSPSDTPPILSPEMAKHSHDATITDQAGRLVVTWPQGRGWAAVHPEVIEGWAEQINQLRDEVGKLTDKLDQPCGSCHPCLNWADETWRRAGLRPPAVITWQDTVARIAQLREENEVLAERLRAVEEGARGANWRSR